MAAGNRYILVRYADLTEPSETMFKNYKIPQTHNIIPTIRNFNQSPVFFGYRADHDDNLLINFFFNKLETALYETTSNLLIACRDPDIEEVMEVYYYT